jgi:hypothetical protein
VGDPLTPLHAATERLADAVVARAQAAKQLSDWRKEAAASFAAGMAEAPESRN